MRPLHYKISSWLLAFTIGIASTFVAQSCLRSVPIRGVSQLQMPALKMASLPDKIGPAPPEGEVTAAEDNEPKRSIALKFLKYSVSEKAEGFYENVADYPQLEVLITEKARRFNRYVEDLILGRINDAKKQGRELIREIQRKGEDNRSVGALTTNYEILYASPDIISIAFDHSYEWTFHPIISYESVNYDLKAGKPLQLKDIFRPHAKYLQALSKLSRIKLVEPYPHAEVDDWMKKGTAPSEKNFKAWNITPEGIIISFDDYQVGTYGMGAPSITIPLAELRNLLKQKYLHLR
jgi:peptidoglycan-N-acetylglucosamine deacetylase